jgi:hypothetical protein
MILKIGLMLEETEDKITVREETHGQTWDRSPISNSFIFDSFGKDCACEGMRDAIHKIMITWRGLPRQIVIGYAILS